MPEPRRVALLARPGEACERLRVALREAGAELVFEADPSQLADAGVLAAAAPQAVLVALDPVVEDALDRLDAVLGDPAIEVIYDEAELAARREGWDAARWVRHLAAKLYGHGNVLPPAADMAPAEGEADAWAPPAPTPAEAGLAPAAPAFAGLTLTDDINALDFDEAAAAPAVTEVPAASGRFARDLAELEQRIAALELEEGPPPLPVTHGPDTVRGAVLVLGGIGGPDAIRQLLSAVPADFPHPLLVSQRLDGGRYDRLVQQMARASALPVQLGEAGALVQRGQVYVVPPELGVEATGEGLRFVAGGDLLAGLPPSDSAIVMLSGADPAQVEPALRHASRGALIAGQTPEGCYDPAAPAELIARGAQAATPPDLVGLLLQRWPA